MTKIYDKNGAFPTIHAEFCKSLAHGTLSSLDPMPIDCDDLRKRLPVLEAWQDRTTNEFFIKHLPGMIERCEASRRDCEDV